jgi:hypothetical protein
MHMHITAPPRATARQPPLSVRIQLDIPLGTPRSLPEHHDSACMHSIADETRQDKTRQDKTRQDKTRQDNEDMDTDPDLHEHIPALC